MEDKDFEITDCEYWVIVIDPEDITENGDVAIVHMCGYIEEPTKEEIDSLKEELRTDEEFGLTEIVDRLEIYPAPQEILEQIYKDFYE